MQYPPLKAIEAVRNGHVDYRTKRVATHFRHFFRALDRNGQPSDDIDEIVTVELTQRANDYYDQTRK